MLASALTLSSSSVFGPQRICGISTWCWRRTSSLLEVAKAVLDFGLSEEALMQILRVSVEALGKVSETMTRVFHMYVHEPFRAQGLGGAELNAATASLADPMIELVEPTVLYFHRKAWERANQEDLLLHLIEETTSPSEVPGEMTRTIPFVYLSSFTPLTEAMGDAAAAVIIERFAHLVRQTAAACVGQVVKQIGDEFMLMFVAPAAAVSFGRSIQAQAAAESRFPALRVGAHTGSVLYRDGDYVGAAVNLVARVASTAARKQLLVTQSVKDQIDDDAGLVPVGPRTLKGLSAPVDLFAVRLDPEPSAKLADPVCGMELDEASADLAWQSALVLLRGMPRSFPRTLGQPRSRPRRVKTVRRHSWQASIGQPEGGDRREFVA